MKTHSLVGRRFGRWSVVDEAPLSPRYQRRFLCRCDCGRTRSVLGFSLTTGRSLSCGCYKATWSGTHKRTHGHARKGAQTAEYRAWVNIRRRCADQEHHSFKYYGGRGIKVCEQWSAFEQFIADMGTKPSPEMTLDRINNDGNYEPTNCRWATPKQQASNRRKAVPHWSRRWDADGEYFILIGL